MKSGQIKNLLNEYNKGKIYLTNLSWHLIRFAHPDFYFHPSSLRRAWLGCMKTKIPLSRDGFHLAEKEGFEPPDPW
jgi:hypothetical protein